VTYHFTLRNTGPVDAKAVFLRAILPAELKHPGGSDLEYEVGRLASGEQRTIDLAMIPERAGLVTPKAMVSNDGRVHAETSGDLQIISSRLQLTRTGPPVRFVGRPGTYVTKVTNQSTAPLQDVTVQERVPRELDVAVLPTGGRWDPRARVITWTLPRLEPGESQELTSELVATVAGAFIDSVTATDRTGNRAELETSIDVKGFSDLVIDVSTKPRTVLVGELISLRLTLKNEGNIAATNVRPRFEIPQGLEVVGATPTTHQVHGNVVEFPPIAEVPVNGEQAFDLILTATQPGSMKVTMQLDSAEYQEPLVRDHAIRVIAETK
jgi:uncharacterized repeat protein (TIGR01451 family)